jgi:dTDP-glucose 4,6-dehydratase
VKLFFFEGLLETTDWNIFSLDRLDFSGNLNRIQDMLKDKKEEVRKRVRIIFCDLRMPVSDQLAVDIGHVDYILHLAAGSHVDRSIEHPMEFVMDNTVGTVNILEFARLYQPCLGIGHSVKCSMSPIFVLDRFVYFSTDEVFGPAPRGVAYKEYDRYNSGNPYAAAKVFVEE